MFIDIMVDKGDRFCVALLAQVVCAEDITFFFSLLASAAFGHVIFSGFQPA